MKKSLIAQILSILILVIAAYSFNFTGSTQAWLGVVSFAATITLGIFLPSGQWVKGWSTTLWITNIAGAVIQVLNAIWERDLMNPMLVNQIIIGLNLLIGYLGKDYTKAPASN